MVYENVVKYCSSNCISIYEFEKTCHIGNGTVGKWKDSNSNPSISTIEKIVSATGIPISKWLE